MQSLGNDFVIIDARSEEIELSNDQITKICDRDYIGCDQLIILKKNQNTDASLIFYNSDGSISGACGNGTRCIAEFLNKENKKETIVLTTSSGELISKILGDRLVSTEIGIPKLKWNEIPLSKDMNSKNLQIKISDKNEISFPDISLACFVALPTFCPRFFANPADKGIIIIAKRASFQFW